MCPFARLLLGPVCVRRGTLKCQAYDKYTGGENPCHRFPSPNSIALHCLCTSNSERTPPAVSKTSRPKERKRKDLVDREAGLYVQPARCPRRQRPSGSNARHSPYSAPKCHSPVPHRSARAALVNRGPIWPSMQRTDTTACWAIVDASAQRVLPRKVPVTHIRRSIALLTPS